MLPFFSVLSLLLATLGFVQYLHGSWYAWWLMLLGFTLMWVLLLLWLQLLWTESKPVGAVAAGESLRKFWLAVRLHTLWCLAFASSFAMIPMYYWMNGAQGHVHGAAADTLDYSKVTMLAAGDAVNIYPTIDLNTERLPLIAQLTNNKLSLTPGAAASLTLTLQNLSAQPQPVLLQAKLAPAAAAQYVHFRWLQEQNIVLAAHESRQFKLQLHLRSSIPESLASMQLALFCYGDAPADPWRKMLAGWPLQKG